QPPTAQRPANTRPPRGLEGCLRAAGGRPKHRAEEYDERPRRRFRGEHPMSFSLSEENKGRELESSDEHGFTAIVRRYRSNPGESVAMPGEPHTRAGVLYGNDVLTEDDLDAGTWEHEHHPDTDRVILTKTEMHTGLQS